MSNEAVQRVLLEQEGVVARRQLLECALTQTAIARLLRRGELVVVHPGVYVEHNGPLTWQQRAWAAVLHTWPAALCHASALRAVEGPGRRGHDDAGPIHVAVARGRHPGEVVGVKVHHRSPFDDAVEWHRGPPRVRYDETVLDLAGRARSELAAVAVLSAACAGRRTTPPRLLAALELRSRMPRRAWLLGVLSDLADGTCSVLEHGYLERVVRPHGLPVGELQAPDAVGGARIYRDVLLAELGVIVELDGVLFHTVVGDRDRDLDRDLDSVVQRRATTVRLGYGQVFDRPCATASKLAALLGQHGWTGESSSCDQCRPLREAG